MPSIWSGFSFQFQDLSSLEEEGVDLHRLDGHGEPLLNPETVIDERKGHLVLMFDNCFFFVLTKRTNEPQRLSLASLLKLATKART